MKIKEQTRKLAAGCSKHCFEVADRTDEVSSKHCFEVVDKTDEVSNHTYDKATLTRFEFDFRRVLVIIPFQKHHSLACLVEPMRARFRQRLVLTMGVMPWQKEEH